MKKTFLLIAVFSLAACASSKDRVVAVKVGDEYYKPEPEAAMAIDTGADKKVVCKRRIVTGSHRKQKTCKTQEQMDRERRDAQENITKNQLLEQRRTIDSRSDGG